jgi:hypothetical protein
MPFKIYKIKKYSLINFLGSFLLCNLANFFLKVHFYRLLVKIGEVLNFKIDFEMLNLKIFNLFMFLFLFFGENLDLKANFSFLLYYFHFLLTYYYYY